MPYINNSWCLKELKDELKKRNNSAIMSKARVTPQRLCGFPISRALKIAMQNVVILHNDMHVYMIVTSKTCFAT